MQIEPRISIITLGVADMARSIRFYRDGLGWPTDAADGAEWAIFRTLGVRFALYPRTKLAQDISPDAQPTQPAFSGITLAHNVRSKAEVDAVLAAAQAAGAKILKRAKAAEWGGYSGYFADPDGYPWEVAWGEMWTFAPDGTLWGGPLGHPPGP
jgi:catechol 2,3-dioxygenase-like lactoylglutathione lyase family enzyme